MSWLFQPIPAAGQQQAGGAAAPPNGWYSPFEKAPLRVIIPVALVASGLVWCPQPIAASPSNTVTIDKWQQPLSKPVPVARAIQGDSFVPFNTTQIVSTTPNGWHSPLSVAANVARPVHTQPSFVPAAFPQYPLGWHQPLSKSAPVATAQPGSSFVPFNTAQTNTATIDKWLQPLSIAAPVTKAQQGDASVPLNTAQINTTTIDEWQQPLVAAVKIAGPVNSQPSFVVPQFDIPRGWERPLSTAPALTRIFDTNQSFPFVTVSTDNNITLDKWQQPLSVAPLVAKAQSGNSFTPFNTAQTNTATIDKWLQPLSVAPSVAKAVCTQASFVPLPFPQANWGWQQPLSQAVRSNSLVPSQWTFVPFDTPQIAAQVGVAWQGPLSVAPRPASAPQSFAFVPFDTGQAAPVSIAGMAWFSPLGTAPSVPVALRGMSFVPFDTVQIQPPVDDGTVLSNHKAGGGGLSRKKWKELQQEIAAERTAILAEEKRQRDEIARAKREAEQARKAKIVAKAQEIADRQRHDDLVANAENLRLAQEAAKAEAEFLAAMLAEIANQEDEDEVLMLLLGL